MFHADEIEAELEDQVGMADVVGYFRNMDVCPECLIAVAAHFATDNLPDLIEHADPIEALIWAFIRGYSVGLIMGRKNPVVKGA